MLGERLLYLLICMGLRAFLVFSLLVYEFIPFVSSSPFLAILYDLGSKGLSPHLHFDEQKSTRSLGFWIPVLLCYYFILVGFMFWGTVGWFGMGLGFFFSYIYIYIGLEHAVLLNFMFIYDGHDFFCLSLVLVRKGAFSFSFFFVAPFLSFVKISVFIPSLQLPVGLRLYNHSLMINSQMLVEAPVTVFYFVSEERCKIISSPTRFIIPHVLVCL